MEKFKDIVGGLGIFLTPFAFGYALPAAVHEFFGLHYDSTWGYCALGLALGIYVAILASRGKDT